MKIVLALLFIICLAGCVTKSKARARAREAFFAGQQHAMSLQQPQSQQSTVSLVGQFRTPVVPWSRELTLARAFVAAEYVGPDPKAIVIVRKGRPISIDPERLLSGEDVALEPGDLVQVTAVTNSTNSVQQESPPTTP
jgi:hypothetical protein